MTEPPPVVGDCQEASRPAGGTIDRSIDEDVLTQALSYGSPKAADYARRLLDEFETLPRVLSASEGSLARFGLPPSCLGILETVRAAMERSLAAGISAKPILGDWKALEEYLIVSMAHLHREEVRVLFLDLKNRLIKDEVMWRGTIDQAQIHTREVIRRALELSASSLILVHNHPSGTPTPSQHDVQITAELRDACRTMKIRLHDHLIISSTGLCSFRALNLL